MTFLKRYGPWAIVTGASSGIGKAFASLLAEKGFNLILIARRTHLIEELASNLRTNSSVEVTSITLDLSGPGFIEPMIQACKGKDIGLIISNAGFGLKGLFHETPIEKMFAMFNVNCAAPVHIAHTFIPMLLKRGRGGILITGSFEGMMGFPWSACYSATKAFVQSLGEGLWGELKDYGIDVLVLAPGSTDTEALPLQGIDKNQLFGLMSPKKVRAVQSIFAFTLSGLA